MDNIIITYHSVLVNIFRTIDDMLSSETLTLNILIKLARLIRLLNELSYDVNKSYSISRYLIQTHRATFETLGVSEELFNIYNSYIDSIDYTNLSLSFYKIFNVLDQYFKDLTGVSVLMFIRLLRENNVDTLFEMARQRFAYDDSRDNGDYDDNNNDNGGIDEDSEDDDEDDESNSENYDEEDDEDDDEDDENDEEDD